MNSTQSKNSNLLVGLYIDNIKFEEVINEAIFSLSKQSAKPDLMIIHSGLSEENVKKLETILEKQTVKIRLKNPDGSIKEEVLESDVKPNYFIHETSSSNFSGVFNEIVSTAISNGYEFFSVVEQEDITAVNWFNTAVNIYAKENEEIGIFLPLLKNTTNGVFNGFMNEASWVENMAEEAGKMDMTLLLRYNCANPLGAVYRVSKIKNYCEEHGLKNESGDEYTPMKASIKISHYYEFFIRMVYNDIKIMTIPRVGYELRFVRKETFNHISSKIPQDVANMPIDKGGITLDEGRFWVDLAKKEYFFDSDRLKTYSPSI